MSAVKCIYLDIGLGTQHTHLAWALVRAARAGRNDLTQHLVSLGAPITRSALWGAAAHSDAAVDLLLAGLQGEHLARAWTGLLEFRMAAGDHERAYALLEVGVHPDRHVISRAYMGLRQQWLDWQPRFHEALDRILQRISREELAASNLALLIEWGRLAHIERALEILQLPACALLPHVLALEQDRAVNALCLLGARLDDENFALCAREVRADGPGNSDRYLRRLFDLTMSQGRAGDIRAQSAAPLLCLMLEDRVSHLHEDLERLIPCVRAVELSQLRSLLEVFSSCERTSKVAQAYFDSVVSALSQISQPTCQP